MSPFFPFGMWMMMDFHNSMNCYVFIRLKLIKWESRLYDNSQSRQLIFRGECHYPYLPVRIKELKNKLTYIFSRRDIVIEEIKCKLIIPEPDSKVFPNLCPEMENYPETIWGKRNVDWLWYKDRPGQCATGWNLLKKEIQTRLKRGW